jgi:hypothetical protein
VYITGSVSGNTNIATTGSFQETNVNGYTNFLAKFNQDGVREWGTYYGTYINTSAGFSFPVINKDNNGNIYLSNYNNGLGNIATSGSYQESLAGSFDCFTAKFLPNGQRLWGTYYGGSELEFTPMKTLIGNNDNFYIVGMTQSQNNISTIGSLQPVYSTNTFQSSYPTNIFIAKFSPIPLNIIDFNNSKFKIFPNPTNQYFIVGNNNNNNFFDYKITDLAGRIVKNGNSKFNEQVGVEDLSSGNYIIKIVEENGTLSNYKLIKN